MKRNPVADRVKAAVTAVLPAGIEILVTGERSDQLSLRINRTKLNAAWAGEGRLRDIRQLLADRRRRPDIVVARRLSPGACAVLREAGSGWVDESGAAEIAVGTLIVSRTGLPDAPSSESERWTSSVIGVAEALLVGTKATVAAAAETTGLSIGSCTGALRMLTRLGLLSAEASRGRASSRRVEDADNLLDAYVAAAAAMPQPASLRVGVIWRDTSTELAALGRRWDEAGVGWAATGGVAAAVIAPLLTSVTTADVYVGARSPAELQAIASRAGLKPIEGGRLTLSTFPTTATMRLARTANGLRVAPWPRIYADLQTAGVRGEEAAEHLREVVRGR